MKRILLLLLVSILMLSCIACNNQERKEITEEEAEQTVIITIPENLLKLTNSTAEDTAKGYEEYSVSSKVEKGEVVLELTDDQKDYLINTNEQFIEETLEEFTNENGLYKYELSEEYKQVTYVYDEKIDATIQAKTIMGVTSMYVLNGILETGNSDWSIEIVVRNCHTDNIVAKGTLPGDGLSVNQKQWEESYNE